MTRINVGVDPRELPGPALLSEHREMTRIPNAVKSGRANLQQKMPDRFKLGEGHVIFFYKRLGFLSRRYDAVLAECRRRGYDVTDKTGAFRDLPAECMGDYEPDERDREITLGRLAEKGHELIPIEKAPVPAQEVGAGLSAYAEPPP